MLPLESSSSENGGVVPFHELLKSSRGEYLFTAQKRLRHVLRPMAIKIGPLIPEVKDEP